MSGRILLVGAGVGGMDMLTDRAARAVSGADVVIYDRLVDRSVLDMVKPGAELIYMGKEPGDDPAIQAGIIDIMIRKAREGKTVVRLKSGDPFVFGRGGEELLALRRAGIEAELVPGLTSAVAVPTLAGLPLTLRAVSSALLIMTGHRADPEDESYFTRHARFEGTIVLLMARKNLPRIAELFMAGGMPPGRPAVALVTKGEKIVVRAGTVGTIATRLGAGSEPTVIVIGEVVMEALYRKVLVTSLAPLDDQKFHDAGLLPINAPVIRLDVMREGIDSFLKDLRAGRIDSVAFLSPRALQALGLDAGSLEALSKLKVFAVGPSTRASLEAGGVPVRMIPDDYSSSGLAKTLASMRGEVGALAVIRSGLADDQLSGALKDAGIPHREYRIYGTAPSGEGLDRFFRALREDLYAVAFTSRSSVRHIVEEARRRGKLPSLVLRLRGLRVICIGAETAKGVEELGIAPEIAEVHAIDGILSRLQGDEI